MSSDDPKLDPFGRPLSTFGIGEGPHGELNVVAPEQIEAITMQRDADEAALTELLDGEDDDDYSDLLEDDE